MYRYLLKRLQYYTDFLICFCLFVCSFVANLCMHNSAILAINGGKFISSSFPFSDVIISRDTRTILMLLGTYERHRSSFTIRLLIQKENLL